MPALFLCNDPSISLQHRSKQRSGGSGRKSAQIRRAGGADLRGNGVGTDWHRLLSGQLRWGHSTCREGAWKWRMRGGWSHLPDIRRVQARKTDKKGKGMLCRHVMKTCHASHIFFRSLFFSQKRILGRMRERLLLSLCLIMTLSTVLTFLKNTKISIHSSISWIIGYYRYRRPIKWRA